MQFQLVVKGNPVTYYVLKVYDLLDNFNFAPITVLLLYQHGVRRP